MRKTGNTVPRGGFLNRPFWRFFAQIGDFFVLNCIWLVSSLPVVTVGASTTALFYVFLKTKSGEPGTLWGMYRKSFKENFRQATFLWLLFLFAALDMFLVGLSVYNSGGFSLDDLRLGGQYGVTLWFLVLFLCAVMLYSAALMAMFRQTTRQCILSAVGLAFSRIFSTLLFLVILAAIGFFTYYVFPPLAFIAVPLAIWLISLRLYGIFMKQICRTEMRGAEAGQAVPEEDICLSGESGAEGGRAVSSLSERR